MNRREILKQLSVIPLVGTTMTPDLFASQASCNKAENQGKHIPFHRCGAHYQLQRHLHHHWRIC